MKDFRQLAQVFRGHGLLAAAFVCALLSPIRAGRAEPPIDDRMAVKLFSQFCFECHSNDFQEADINVEAALVQRPLVRNQAVWENVLERLKKREMPPEDVDQPSAAQFQQLAAWLDNRITQFDYEQIRHPGYEPARRLTNLEYDNTVSQLFGATLTPAKTFPTDLSGLSGFENSANSLFLSTNLVERYFGAAERVVEQTMVEEAADERVRKQVESSIYVARPDENTTPSEAAEQVLRRFLLRAYRRPPSDAELARLMAHFDQHSSEGASFEQAVQLCLQVSLISPQFLMRLESVGGDQQEPVNAWDMASRLSYFLWASMPDDELFDAAADGSLLDEEELAKQVDRLLGDPRSDSLGTVLAAQWLGFDIVGTRVRADPIDNPFATDSLYAAMRAETAMLFLTMIWENRPLTDLLNADYTFLNEELADLYDIDDIEGPQMRRVTIRDKNRGGILGHAGLLMATSHPWRTSPVLRGNWLLSEVLGTPPPPPPPDAGEFDDEILENSRLSAREKIEMHRSKPRCAGCHAEIDPLGFGLENFDRFGRWRDKIRRKPVDASGRLPEGIEFNGPAELRSALLKSRMDDLARQCARKMLAYALGRQLEYYDEPTVRTILDVWKQDDYRMRTLVHQIASSYPFRFRKLQRPDIERDVDLASFADANDSGE